MTDPKVTMTLILDNDMVVTDVPCTGATVVAQYADGYFALAITAEGTCVLGFEGEQPASVSMRDLVDLFATKPAETLH